MEFTEEQKRAALQFQHSVVLTDNVLKLGVDGFQVKLTVGWEPPQGGILPAVTLVMPLDFAKELGVAISAALSENKQLISDQHKALQKTL